MKEALIGKEPKLSYFEIDEDFDLKTAPVKKRQHIDEKLSLSVTKKESAVENPAKKFFTQTTKPIKLTKYVSDDAELIKSTPSTAAASKALEIGLSARSFYSRPAQTHAESFNSALTRFKENVNPSVDQMISSSPQINNRNMRSDQRLNALASPRISSPFGSARKRFDFSKDSRSNENMFDFKVLGDASNQAIDLTPIKEIKKPSAVGG